MGTKPLGWSLSVQNICFGVRADGWYPKKDKTCTPNLCQLSLALIWSEGGGHRGDGGGGPGWLLHCYKTSIWTRILWLVRKLSQMFERRLPNVVLGRSEDHFKGTRIKSNESKTRFCYSAEWSNKMGLTVVNECAEVSRFPSFPSSSSDDHPLFKSNVICGQNVHICRCNVRYNLRRI